MAVSKLRIPASHLQARVRSAAANSSNVVFVPPPEKRSMAGMILFHQVLSCLREGNIVGKPRLTDAGLWEFRMERYAANRTYATKSCRSRKWCADRKGLRDLVGGLICIATKAAASPMCFYGTAMS
jgi:hypothetical protein